MLYTASINHVAASDEYIIEITPTFDSQQGIWNLPEPSITLTNRSWNILGTYNSSFTAGNLGFVNAHSLNITITSFDGNYIHANGRATSRPPQGPMRPGTASSEYNFDSSFPVERGDDYLRITVPSFMNFNFDGTRTSGDRFSSIITFSLDGDHSLRLSRLMAGSGPHPLR